MTLSKFILLFIALSTLQLIYSQKCLPVDSSSGTIDISNLKDKKFVATGNDGSTYSVKICNAFQSDAPCQLSKVHASIEKSSDGNCRGLGQFDQSTNVVLINPADPSKGVSLTYSGGDPSGTIGTSTQVDLICDPSNSLSFTCNTPDCRDARGSLFVYHFILKTSDACPQSGRPFLWPVGILGLLFILAIPIFILYWPIGIVVNKFVRKKEGIEIVPNISFWKDLPFLVKDGFLFLFKDIIYGMIISKIIAKIQARRGYEPA